MSESFSGTVSIAPADGQPATISLQGTTGDAILGGSGRDGDVLLRDGAGTNRVRLNADGQRIELLNASGQIIGMQGGGGNIRAGSNGLDGSLFLYRSGADNIFSNAQWSVRLVANDGRLEIRNAAGQLICMLGANGNLRLGSNGSDGDVVLHRSAQGDIFNDGSAAIHLDAENTRIQMRNAAGQLICMMGDNGNLRLGTNGTDGDILLYPSSASDIFNDGAATIHLDANSGDITLRNADCAEEFDVRAALPVLAGTVMCAADGGALAPSRRAYDSGVVGVVSGAGDYRPGLVLDRRPGSAGRLPVAMMGKVCVRANAESGAIRPGDLLTTSSAEGEAMRAADRGAAFGAVIGKALGPLDGDAGLVPMVIALQ